MSSETGVRTIRLMIVPATDQHRAVEQDGRTGRRRRTTTPIGRGAPAIGR